MRICIALIQGEITLQSAKSIYHTTPQVHKELGNLCIRSVQ